MDRVVETAWRVLVVSELLSLQMKGQTASLTTAASAEVSRRVHDLLRQQIGEIRLWDGHQLCNS
jgi:hypothetical protein